MAKLFRLKKCACVILFSSLIVVSCSAFEGIPSGNQALKTEFAITKSSTMLKMVASAVSTLFWGGITFVSSFAIFDALKNAQGNKRLIQGGVGAVALLIALYNFGLVGDVSSDDCSCDPYSTCGSNCGDSSYDSDNDQTWVAPDTCVQHHHHNHYHYYGLPICAQQPNQDSPLLSIPEPKNSESQICNAGLTEFWEDPINY